MMRDAKVSDVLWKRIRRHMTTPMALPTGRGSRTSASNTDHEAGSADVISGSFMPMVANDGPHYGDNVKLAGPGKYRLKLTIEPPGADPHAHFGRHVDKETGVGPWFRPFSVEYEFAYAGVGKKGGY
jgi:uncharacterized protein involved in high-affinity Fe2+ transport